MHTLCRLDRHHQPSKPLVISLVSAIDPYYHARSPLSINPVFPCRRCLLIFRPLCGVLPDHLQTVSPCGGYRCVRRPPNARLPYPPSYQMLTMPEDPLDNLPYRRNRRPRSDRLPLADVAQPRAEYQVGAYRLRRER